MKFGEALELCRQGKLIRRSGWNGKNQFVYYQEGSVIETDALRCPALKNFLEDNRDWLPGMKGRAVKIMGHFDIFTEQKVIQCGWLASQGDMQAEDWEVMR